MKYMVMVNGKYMTQVEVEGSALAAEHYLLDDVRYGIEAAQAFTCNEMRTDYFIGLMQTCELIPIDGIVKKSELVKELVDLEIDDLERQLADIDAKIESLKDQKKEIAFELNKAKCNRGKAL